jgi:hypothetical protein
MMEAVVGSIRGLRQTLAVLEPSVDRRCERSRALQPVEFAALLRISRAYLGLESDIADLREMETASRRADPAATLQTRLTHQRFIRVLTVLTEDVLKLKSKQHNRLRERLGEYLHVTTERTPRTLAEIGRALNSAWLML